MKRGIGFLLIRKWVHTQEPASQGSFRAVLNLQHICLLGYGPAKNPYLAERRYPALQGGESHLWRNIWRKGKTTDVTTLITG
jgi:hypothetical protein